MLRFVGSLLTALLVVGGLTLLGVGAYFARPPVYQVEAFRVEPATHAELELVRASEGNGTRPAPSTPPSDELRNGFVQLSFVVAPDGRAQNISVLAAVPAGYYEQAAIAQVRRGQFAPPAPGVHDTRTQIVAFQYRPRASDQY